MTLASEGSVVCIGRELSIIRIIIHLTFCDIVGSVTIHFGWKDIIGMLRFVVIWGAHGNQVQQSFTGSVGDLYKESKEK